MNQTSPGALTTLKKKGPHGTSPRRAWLDMAPVVEVVKRWCWNNNWMTAERVRTLKIWRPSGDWLTGCDWTKRRTKRKRETACDLNTEMVLQTLVLTEPSLSFISPPSCKCEFVINVSMLCNKHVSLIGIKTPLVEQWRPQEANWPLAFNTLSAEVNGHSSPCALTSRLAWKSREQHEQNDAARHPISATRCYQTCRQWSSSNLAQTWTDYDNIWLRGWNYVVVTFYMQQVKGQLHCIIVIKNK